MARIVIEDLTLPVQEYEKGQMKSILGGVIGPFGVLSPFDMNDALGTDDLLKSDFDPSKFPTRYV